MAGASTTYLNNLLECFSNARMRSAPIALMANSSFYSYKCRDLPDVKKSSFKITSSIQHCFIQVPSRPMDTVPVNGKVCNNVVKTDLLGLKVHYPENRKKSMSVRPYSYLVNPRPSLCHSTSNLVIKWWNYHWQFLPESFQQQIKPDTPLSYAFTRITFRWLLQMRCK